MDGIYAITVHVVTHIDHSMSGSIMKEDNSIGRFISDLSTDLRLSGGNLIVTDCLEGERVWVRFNVDNAKLTSTNRYSMLAGFIIQH